MTDIIPPATSPVRLLMVTADNNNKFYNMTPVGDSFIAEFGRVGASAQTKSYSKSKWDTVYKEKIKKGYKDITGLVRSTTTKSEYKPISDHKINSLFETLLGVARKSVKENYTISSEVVTLAQIKEAQGFLDQLTSLISAVADHDHLNKLLLGLYTVIPRRMSDVRFHLVGTPIKSDEDLQYVRSLIDSEQSTLDVMNGQVKMREFSPSDDDINQRTILDVLGIEVTHSNESDQALVAAMMEDGNKELKAVYRVNHLYSRPKFADYVAIATNKKTELFWHGSRNENWISILQSGLKIRPSNAILTGAMFGHGIYFADRYRKSANYTSLNGAVWTHGGSRTAFLALMDVHVGEQYRIPKWDSSCYNLSKDVLLKKGAYDSVFAEKGVDLRNNEYIVYDDAQSTIKYLIQVGN